MPIIDKGTVADPQRYTTHLPTVSMMTGCLTRLAALAAHCTCGVWNRRRRNGTQSSDWGVNRAEVWYDRASLRLEAIFDSRTLTTEWWRQLRHDLYGWLTRKHDILEYAYETLCVPLIDIASQIVSVQILFCVKRSTLHTCAKYKPRQYIIDIDAIAKYLTLVSQLVLRAWYMVLILLSLQYIKVTYDWSSGPSRVSPDTGRDQ